MTDIAKKKMVKKLRDGMDGPTTEEIESQVANITKNLDGMYFDHLNEEQNTFLREYFKRERKDVLGAYRAAYQNNMSDKAAQVRAYKMLASPAFQVVINSIEKMAQASLVVTLEDHVGRLRELGRKAESARQYSAAITAEVNVGKACGLYITRTEVTGKDGAPIGVANVPVEEYREARKKILEDV